MKTKTIAVLLAALLLLSMGPSLATGEQSLQRKIVIFDNAVNVKAQAALLEKAGFGYVKDLPLVNGMVVMVPPQAEAALANRPGVLRVENDTLVSASGKPSAVQPPEALPWGIDIIDADLAWTTSTASGVKVAIIDTGIDLSHPDLAANIKGGINLVNVKKNASDDNGHGTHVAGIVAALDNTIGVVGAGNAASLYAVKVLDRSGMGWTSDIIAGLGWCVDNGIQVANMSLGSNYYNETLHSAVKAANAAGLIMVAAAGNDGAAVDYPAALPEVIAVSATDSNNNVTSWSSRGPEVLVAAPGSNIYSTYKGGAYASMSGTSMAAPHVAGAIALKLQVAPGLTPAQMVILLAQTATPLSGATADEQGAGLVNALALVNAE